MIVLTSYMKKRYIPFIFLIILGIIVATFVLIQRNLFPSNEVHFSNEEVINIVSSDIKTPVGFYHEDFYSGDTHSEQVFALFIKYEKQRVNEEWVFYCSNDADEARTHVESNIEYFKQLSDAYISMDKKIIGTSENERFFEFSVSQNFSSRAGQVTGSETIRERVYKCSYVEDLNYDSITGAEDASITSQSYVGKFAQKPVTVKNVKELIESLWFSRHNVADGGSQVLVSFTQDIGSSIRHTIYETKTMFGDWNQFNETRLIKSVHTIDKESGYIELKQEKIKTVNW